MATTKASFRKSDKNQRLIETAVNANSTSSVTPSVFTGDASSVALQVVGETGTHATHVVKLQGSVDGTTFVDTATTITGEGGALLTTPVYPWHRAKVTTAEGGTSTVTIGIFAKAA